MSFQPGYMQKQFVMICFTYLQYFAILYTINIHPRRILRQKTIHIPHPPVLKAKLNDMLLALIVDLIVWRCTLENKILVATGFPFL